MNKLLPQPTRLRAMLLSLLFMNLFTGTTVVYAATLSQDYAADLSEVSVGMMVALDQDEPSKVVPLDSNTTDYAIGVVTDDQHSSLHFKTSDNEDVSVATQGEVIAVVSSDRGPIRKGDFIGASDVAGIGMRVSEDTAKNQRLIGVVLEDLSLSTTQEFEVTRNGKTEKITVGYVPVSIINREKSGNNLQARSSFESIVFRLAGKNVSVVKIIISVVIFISCLVLAGAILVGAVKTSFDSIGRNPLASSSIYHSLLRVSGITVSVILIGAALAYLVLAL